jgi:hypothetical protein
MTRHESSSKKLTQLLLDWSSGNRAALEELTPLVHGELRRMAHRYFTTPLNLNPDGVPPSSIKPARVTNRCGTESRPCSRLTLGPAAS